MHYDPVDFVRSSIRSIPDWPKPGVMFRDITPVLQDPRCFRALIDIFVYRYMRTRLDLVAGVDARGFILGSVIAYELNLGFVPIRKKGKLPHAGDDLQDIEIMKEYGADHLYFRKSDIAAGKVEDGVIRVTILDDILATGGTSEGIAKALEATKVMVDGKECSVKVAEYIFVVELNGLNGRERLEKIAPVYSIAHV